MAYSKEQIQARLAEWNAAAVKLPPARDGLQTSVDGLHFSAMLFTDGVSGNQKLQWELMSSNWRPTGIIWPA